MNQVEQSADTIPIPILWYQSSIVTKFISLLLQNALVVSMARIAWSNVSVRTVLRVTSSPACVTAPLDGQEYSVA